MDPLSSLGFAVNVLTILEGAGKLMTTAYALKRSPSGTLATNRAIENASEDLVRSVNGLMSSKVASDETLKRLGESTCTLAQKLLTTLGTAKLDGQGGKWKVLKKAVRNVWIENDVKRMQESLGELRHQLNTHMSVYLVTENSSLRDTLGSIEDRVKKMSDKLDELGQLRKASCSEHSMDRVKRQESGIAQGLTKEKEFDCFPGVSDQVLATDQATMVGFGAPSVIAHSALQPVSISPASDQPLGNVYHQSRPACNGSTCGCVCHLENYFETPRFLQRFIGALTYKGICQNHPDRPVEMKYWVPEWILSYNITLWFQKTASGTPSLGLRFQRKVCWGSEDTIIRFSYLGDTEGIEKMLVSGRGSLDDVDSKNGSTSLHYAVQKLHPQACQRLIHFGADRLAEDASGISPAQKAWEHIYVNRGNPEIMLAFRSLFPSLEPESWQFSLLHKAVLGLEGLTLAKQINSDYRSETINVRDGFGRTALHWSALRGDLKAVELLLDADPDVDAFDKFKCTALTYAVSAGALRITELLILRRADVNSADRAGQTPLHYSAMNENNMNAMKLLVQAGAQVDRKNHSGNTPFALAAIYNAVSCGKYLLLNGAHPHTANKYGDTPLLEAVHHNRHDFLQMLLEMNPVYSDHITKSGSTILHQAALEGDSTTVAILAASNVTGVDIQSRNSNGKTAMDIFQDRINPPKGFKKAFLNLLESASTTK